MSKLAGHKVAEGKQLFAWRIVSGGLQTPLMRPVRY